MSEKREFPILNGKLLSDLDANGYKILGAILEVPPESIKEAIGELLSAKADKSVVDELNKSVASVTTETQRLARDSRAKDDLSVYSFSGGTTEYYLADNFLPVTGPEMYDFSKITFAPGTSAGIEAIQVFDANGVQFGSFRADTLRWLAGDTVSFGGKDISEVTLSSRIVGGSFVATEAKLLTSDKVVLPGADAKSGEVADAKAVFKYFRLKNDLKYFTTEIKIVPVWTFSLALGGEEFDTVDMTLQKRTVSSGITHENWAGYSTGGMYRCELLRVMTPLDGNATFSATIEGVSVSSEVYGAGSLEKILNFSDMTFGSSSLTASGTYSSAKQVEVVTADDKIALEGAVKEVTDALTEELRQLNETSIPRYIFTEVEVEDGSVNLLPYTNAKLLSDGTAFEVAVGEGDGKTRDCVLRVECGETAPTITWGANFHPRTDAETDFACVAGKRNVYWITEHAPNEFVVAGWQETEGGSAE